MKKWIPIVARVLLGLVYLGASVTFLLKMAPVPTDLPENLKAFNAGMEASGYMMNLVKVTELVCGLLLISGFFVPLALVVTAPIVLNIFFVHAFLAPEGLPLAIIMGVITIYLSFFSPYSPKIRALFSPK